MDFLENLSTNLSEGTILDGCNEKKFRELIRTYQKVDGPQIVKLYPLRGIAHEHNRYCIYACPFNKTEIDNQTLSSINLLVNGLKVEDIRRNSVNSGGYHYFLLDNAGKHIATDIPMDSVMEIGNKYDNVVLFTDVVLWAGNASKLECGYAIVGKDKNPNEYKIEPIPNSVIGKEGPAIQFLDSNKNVENYDEVVTIGKFNLAIKIVVVIIAMILLIWYLIMF